MMVFAYVYKDFVMNQIWFFFNSIAIIIIIIEYVREFKRNEYVLFYIFFFVFWVNWKHSNKLQNLFK